MDYRIYLGYKKEFNNQAMGLELYIASNRYVLYLLISKLLQIYIFLRKYAIKFCFLFNFLHNGIMVAYYVRDCIICSNSIYNQYNYRPYQRLYDDSIAYCH
jgi:hypothetical protein